MGLADQSIPSNETSSLRQLFASMLSKGGALFSAFTLFGYLSEVIAFAALARWLHLYWVDALGAVWGAMFAWLLIDFPPQLTGPFSLVVFFISIGVGANLLSSTPRNIREMRWRSALRWSCRFRLAPC